VVGNTDRVVPVVAVAGIDAGQPFASSALGLAVPEMKQAGFEVAVIGLAARLEVSASGATSEGGVADSTGHGEFSPVEVVRLFVCDIHQISGVGSMECR